MKPNGTCTSERQRDRGVVKVLWRKLRARLPAGPAAAEVFWSEAFEAGGIPTWLAEPDIRRYVNGLISGSGDVWPMDWFRGLYGDDFRHGLSVGCGDGALERDVLSKGICRTMLAVDLSRTALELAEQFCFLLNIFSLFFVQTFANSTRNIHYYMRLMTS